ncbi:LysE family translocator [Kiloniella sp. b19]|uniref:LysE family translocator n=1 Tax=Kiloniella sp. GXU_MW_B19 TaxID=3141326 RepID=UPI0031DC8955
MDFERLGLFALTETLLSLSPGPAVFLVIGLSVRYGFRFGVFSALGIASTNALYFSLSALGVGAAILASAFLFTVIKWIGAAYLVWIGIGMIRPLLARFLFKRETNAAVIDENSAARAVSGQKMNDRAAFWKGFAVQASNPKNIAFFVAILPQFIDPGAGDVALQLLILGVVSISLEIPILLVYGLASSSLAARLKQKALDWLEAVSGSVLVALGGLLALSKRME